MFKYVLKRLALALAVFLIITSMCFILVKLLPNQMPPTPPGKDPNIWKMRYEALGYGKPLLEQYRIFIVDTLFGGDWGFSTLKGLDTWKYFVGQLPYTMIVNVYTMLIAVPIGLMVGIYAALKKNKWQDHLISTGVMVFISVPGYVYCFLIQYLLCFKMVEWIGWSFPIKGMQAVTVDQLFTWDVFVSVVPAILALGLGTIAGLARYTRAELCEVLTQEYMLLARTKGLTRGQATVRHALRNSMVPIFPMIMGEFIGIIGGSLIVEKAFQIPGVGKMYLDAITARDYNMYMLLNCFYTFIGLLSGIVVDLSYGFVDPRIRMGEK